MNVLFFDERVAVGDNLAKGTYDQCYACGSAINEIDKKSSEYRMGVYCPNVRNSLQINKRKGLRKGKNKFFLAKEKVSLIWGS